MSDAMNTCSRCGRALRPDEVHMAPPLITAGELVRTAVKSPALLKGDLPDVPFCPECRAIVAKQRPREQLKVLLGILAILLVILLLVIFL